MAQEQSGSYRIFGTITTVASPIVALQYQASATNVAEIISIAVTQWAVDISDAEVLTILRQTAGATVTAGVVGTSVMPLSGPSPAAGFQGVLGSTGTGLNATANGTAGHELYSRGFNCLAGHQYAWLPQERLWVPASGIIALRLEGKMAANWMCEMVVKEYK